MKKPNQHSQRALAVPARGLNAVRGGQDKIEKIELSVEKVERVLR